MEKITDKKNINHKLTFISGIIQLVMAAIYLVCFGIVLYVFISSRFQEPATDLGEAIGLIVVILIKILFSVVGLPLSFVLVVKYTVFGIISLINSKKEDISNTKSSYVFMAFGILSIIALTIVYIMSVVSGGLKAFLIILPIWLFISGVQVVVSVLLLRDKRNKTS